jgi:ADP-heptose:LPS heptosyltransferase
VLVIQLAKIGDLVCTTPLLRALANRGDDVTVVCLERTAPILAGNTAVHRVITVDLQRIGLFFAVRALQPDVTIALFPHAFNAMLGLWSGAPEILYAGGKPKGIVTTFFRFFYRHRLEYSRGTRTYDFYMQVAEAVRASRVPYVHEVTVTQAERDAGAKLLPEKTAVLAVSAGNRIKEWPIERFIEIGQELSSRGWTVAFSSTDKAKTSAAAARVPNAIDIGGLSLRALIGALSRAKLLVSVDTGPLYIAHALGVPVVDIIGPVDPREQPPPEGPTVAHVRAPGIEPSSFVAETLRHSTADQRASLENTTVDMVMQGIDRVTK